MIWSARERTHAVVLLVLMALYGVYYLVWCWPQPWYIEDAAISFSYARNLVDGEGLVPYPGGERVEGYSNPLWTFLMAFWQLLGITPWISSKVMGFVFGAATLPLSYMLARQARPEAEVDGPPHLALLSPLLLAASTQFVLWNDSGLENSLFCFLLALGMWRLVVETTTDRKAPWSALAFFLLTMTRPDGVAYAGLALVARTLATLRRRQWLALPLWVVAFTVPFVAYNYWRYEYFAWPFPTTYYAKVKNFQPFGWTVGGWKQFKEWSRQYFVAYAAPIPVIALIGLSRWRKWLILGLMAVLATLTLWDGRAGVPTAIFLWWSTHVSAYWTKAVVWYILGGSVLLGLGTLRRPGWEARALLWASFCTGVFFWVWSFGDWMKGFRWGSQVSVPLFTLCGLGIAMLADSLPQSDRVLRGRVRMGTLYGLLLAIALGAPNGYGSYQMAIGPETSPNSVHRRVNYMSWVQKRLGVDNVTLLDVDMGAHLWWSGWDVVDIAGLVDVPISHHQWQRSFSDEYIFEERRPEFAHVHGAWANTSKLNKSPHWKTTYFEIPGYPTGGRTLHVGNHVRLDLLTGESYDPKGTPAWFAGDIAMAGFDLPAPKVASGGKLYVDTAWFAAKKEDGFRVLALLASTTDAAQVVAMEVAPGYDWYKPEIWKPDQYVWGRWGLPIPESLPHGTYELGFVVLDEATGTVLPFQTTGNPATEPPADRAARYMQGEWFTGQMVEVGSVDDAVGWANEVYTRALNEATSGDCDIAERSFRTSRRHVARNDGWYASHRPAMDDALVACLLRSVDHSAPDVEQAKIVARARRIDHRNEQVVALGEELGGRLEAAGDTLRDSQDWQGSYDAYVAALSVDPSRSWARRHAEEVRDARLGLLDEDGDLKADAPKTPTPGPKAPAKPPTPKTPTPKPPAEPPAPGADTDPTTANGD